MSPRPPRLALVVFAKAPRAGLVKTRMCPPLTSEAAATLYGCMLDDVLEASVVDAAEHGLEPVLAVHPPDAMAELADRAPSAFSVVAQQGGGLGERMDHAIRQAAAAGFEGVVLRGSDNPMLGDAHVRSMLELLVRHDVVLTPDRDGGYGAVAVRAPVPGLFDHAMSSDHLLDDTVAAARECGASAALAPESFDVDSIEDLRDLEAWLEQGGEPQRCARTAQWITAYDRDL